MSSSEQALSNSNDDLFYGLGIIVFSSCGISIYLMVLMLLISSTDYKDSFAYQFMVHLGLTDIIQLIVHFITGIFVMSHWYFSTLLNRICGALSNAWISMLFFSGALSVNRFVQILFPHYYSRIFNVKTMLAYVIFGWSICIVFTVAYLTPFLSYEFDPADFSWKYYGLTKPIFEAINRYAEFVVVFGSAVLYCIILGFIWFHWFNKSNVTASSFERKITIQVLLICTVHIVLVLFWEFGFQALPDTKFVWYIYTFVWIVWCSFNPIIYLTFNNELRNRFLKAIRLRKKQGKTGTNTILVVQSRDNRH